MAQSKRTGGPKTAAGKMSSAKNAIKTGAYSTLIILPGESEKDFQELEERFVRDFSPEDIVAATMVYNLTVLTWKKLRAQKIEHAGLLRTLTANLASSEYYKFNFPAVISDPGRALALVDSMSQVEEEEWKLAFGFCKMFIKTNPTAQELKVLEQASPKLYKYLEAEAVIDNRQDCALWPAMNVKTSDGKVHPFIKFYCEYFIKENPDTYNVISDIDRLRQIVKEIKESRLLKFMQESSIQRVHDDLDRAFYRTLSELRKHQHWRQERNTVDVTSED
ncbi:hypothetical protein MCEZLEM10_01133 [Methylophilaceae bacterium]